MRHSLCLFGIFSTLATAVAKDSRTCRIVFLNAPDNAPQKLHLFDGKKSREVELPSLNFSPVYTLPAGDLTLTMLPEEVSDPATVSPDAPAFTLSEAVTDFYLVVSSDPENEIAPVKIEVVDATKLKNGQVHFSNLTLNTLDGQIGTEKLDLEPLASIVLNAPTAGGEDYDVNISFKMPESDLLRPLCETKWHPAPDGRTVVFVVQKEGERIPRVMALNDYR